MTRIIICGCSGAMGRNVTATAATRSDCTVVAGIDTRLPEVSSYPVFASIGECTVECDAVIDFSSPSALDSLLAYGAEKKVPLILCATGYSDDQIARIREASATTPIFKTGNLSLGINLLISLAKKAAAVLGDSFDIEIVEKHHNQKVDAPSGTALMLADAVAETLEERPSYVYDRHSCRMKRDRHEIGIHSIRGGTITGQHDVIFAGQNEVVTLSHTAESKGVFAAGAVNAAVFMAGKPAGLYDMDDLLASVD